jgi:hypothetical protein
MSKSMSKPCPILAVIALVAEECGVAPAALAGRVRCRALDLPRQLAMWVAREATGAKVKEIGAVMGGRDRSCVCILAGKLERAREKDPDLRAFSDRLLAAVQGRVMEANAAAEAARAAARAAIEAMGRAKAEAERRRLAAERRRAEEAANARRQAALQPTDVAWYDRDGADGGTTRAAKFAEQNEAFVAAFKAAHPEVFGAESRKGEVA